MLWAAVRNFTNFVFFENKSKKYFLGLTDVVMYSHPKGYLPTISRFMWWIGPAVGMASAFTTGTYIATNLRGKDDKWNYAVGSCAAGGVAGCWMRSPVVGFGMCLAFCKSSISFKLPRSTKFCLSSNRRSHQENFSRRGLGVLPQQRRQEPHLDWSRFKKIRLHINRRGREGLDHWKIRSTFVSC